MNATLRFQGLLAQVGLDPEISQAGDWLLALFRRLLPDYTPPKAVAGHDMNSHVLFMLVLAVQMRGLLGPKLGCEIEHLLAAVLLHNLDRILALKTSRAQDPDGSKFRDKITERFRKETHDCPFPKSAIVGIFKTLLKHSKPYDKVKGPRLLKRVQELDMISRLNCLSAMAASAERGFTAEVFCFEQPWFSKMEPADQYKIPGHSIYSVQLLMINWYRRFLSNEVRPLARPFLADYLAYIRALGRLIAFTTGQKDLSEQDNAAALNKV